MKQESRLMVRVGINCVWAFSVDEVITAHVEFNRLNLDPHYFWSFFGWFYQCDARGLSAWQNKKYLKEYNRRLSELNRR